MQNVSAAAEMAAPIRLRLYVWLLASFWTVAIAIVLTWELSDEVDQVYVEAHSEAWGIWQKEDAIYRWAVTRGNIYIPLTPATPSDPRLASLPERDVARPSGGKLTLIGPATIMRQAFGGEGEEAVRRGRLSSLRPVNPANAPDPWEKRALEAFAAGQKEFVSEETVGGKGYLRLMRPLITEPACLTCHVEQGRNVGDIRGGLSVAVPLAPIWIEQMPDIIHRILGYGGMWLLGLGGIAFFSRKLRQQIVRRSEAEREILERRQAEQWLMESEERFRGYFEQGLVGMAILSADREWLEVNDRLCRMLGYTEEELTAKTWKELSHPDDLPAEDVQFRRLLDGPARSFVIDKRFVRKDGNVLQAGLSAQCMKKPDGTIDCLLILVQDMSHRTPT